MARKGRARRFREARELKRGFDDGMFREGGGSLADVADGETTTDDDWDDDEIDRTGWDEEDPLKD